MDGENFDSITAMAFTAFSLPEQFEKAVDAMQVNTSRELAKERTKLDIARAKRLAEFTIAELAELGWHSRLAFAYALATALSTEIAELESQGKLDAAWLRARQHKESKHAKRK